MRKHQYLNTSQGDRRVLDYSSRKEKPASSLIQEVFEAPLFRSVTSFVLSIGLVVSLTPSTAYATETSSEGSTSTGDVVLNESEAENEIEYFENNLAGGVLKVL
jgi:hypothetical protein